MRRAGTTSVTAPLAKAGVFHEINHSGWIANQENCDETFDPE
jgi:hypothetical protein